MLRKKKRRCEVLQENPWGENVKMRLRQNGGAGYGSRKNNREDEEFETIRKKWEPLHFSPGMELAA